VDAKDGWDSSWKEGHEVTNAEEVRLVLLTLQKLLRDPELAIKAEDGTYPVGIITPYAAQRELIIKELEKAALIDEKGKPLVETNSVDGFQGREKDVIIFSAVRSNDTGTVGFLHDWRRINVMLTRAKRGLIIIGNRETLQTDIYWKSWLKWASTHGCIQGESARGSWTQLCLIEDEWVIKPQDIPVKPTESVDARVALEDSWVDCLDCAQPTMQSMEAEPKTASQIMGSRDNPVTHVDSEMGAHNSREMDSVVKPMMQDLGSWEDLATDVESEDADCSPAADGESSVESQTTESWMTESLWSSAVTSLTEVLQQDFGPGPMQTCTPTPNELAALPTSHRMYAPTAPDLVERVGNSLRPPTERLVPQVFRLRSEAGQQKQRERQKQRRRQYRQTRK